MTTCSEDKPELKTHYYNQKVQLSGRRENISHKIKLTEKTILQPYELTNSKQTLNTLQHIKHQTDHQKTRREIVNRKTKYKSLRIKGAKKHYMYSNKLSKNQGEKESNVFFFNN